MFAVAEGHASLRYSPFSGARDPLPRRLRWLVQMGPPHWRRFRAATPARNATWKEARPGLDWTELNLSGRGEARRIRVIAARLDPARFRLSLENGMAPGDSSMSGPWTWLRQGGACAQCWDVCWRWGLGVGGARRYRVPSTECISRWRAVVVDSSGTVRRWPMRRSGRGGRKGGQGTQSYPALLDNGELPSMLTTSGGEIDLQHRDARLALGLDEKGCLIIALTRFDVLGPSFGSIPFGLTIPETALLMRGLGAQTAVALDGGISAQLLLRDAVGETQRWPGLRPVPLGLSAVPVERQ